MVLCAGIRMLVKPPVLAELEVAVREATKWTAAECRDGHIVGETAFTEHLIVRTKDGINRDLPPKNWSTRNVRMWAAKGGRHGTSTAHAGADHHQAA